MKKQACKQALLLLAVLAIVCNGMAQTFTTNFAVRDAKDSTSGKVYKLSVIQKDSPVNAIIIQRLLPDTTVPNTAYANKLPRSIFKLIVEAQLARIKDTSYLKTHLLDSTLDDVYNQYFVQMNTDSLLKDTSTLEYGAGEYYGLSTVEKLHLLNLLKMVKCKQQEQYIQLNSHPGMRRNFLGIFIGGLKKDVATSDSDASKKYKDDHDSIQAWTSQIRKLNSYRKPLMSLIGSANVITSFKTDQSSQIGGGFGILASKPNYSEFVGAFTISQSNDTVVSTAKATDFGNSILVPGVRKLSLLTSYRLLQLFPTARSAFWSKIGLAWNVNITPYNWAIRTTANDADSLTAKVLPVSMDLMFPFNWVRIYHDGEEVNISTDVGFTGRYILGNTDAATRKEFLGYGHAFYGGAIAGINIKFNGLRFQFHVPLLFGESVPGLTRGQVYASMSFVASIIGPNSIQKLFSH